jgi:hypothetical protein
VYLNVCVVAGHRQLVSGVTLQHLSRRRVAARAASEQFADFSGRQEVPRRLQSTRQQQC